LKPETMFATGPASPPVRYRRGSQGWQEIRGASVTAVPELQVEQGLNEPQRLVARVGTRRVVLLDPNPQLGTLRLGRVEQVHFTMHNGEVHSAGLYYPPDFVKGKRYPLVIQTHGFDSTAFAPDGTFPSGSGAQPMAAHGIMVLQLSMF